MRRALLPLLLILLFLVACAASDESKIRETLNRREEALTKKDLSLYLSCISKAYQDKNEDMGRLQNRMEGYFSTFDHIQYTNWDRSIQIEGDKATVVQQFHLEVEKGGKKHQFSGKEAFFLRREKRDWKIVAGL